jgi:hypothetical protein
LKTSQVLQQDEANAIFRTDAASDLILVARSPLQGQLKYASTPLMAYLQANCNPPTNDCPDGVFDSDCTHFVCHALNRAGVYVRLPSAACTSALCIRVNELAASLAASVASYSNVTQLQSHADTRAGDFCFIPSWFGMRKEHAMVLADTATPTGAAVYAHTNAHCGDVVPFEGAGCVYYRIDEA